MRLGSNYSNLGSSSTYVCCVAGTLYHQLSTCSSVFLRYHDNLVALSQAYP